MEVEIGAKRLARAAVGVLVTAAVRMTFGVRGDSPRVSMKGPGADMAHDHQDCDGNEED